MAGGDAAPSSHVPTPILPGHRVTIPNQDQGSLLLLDVI